MPLDVRTDLSTSSLVLFALSLTLVGLAVFNYLTGIYGGAIVSGLGAIVAALFGVLMD